MKTVENDIQQLKRDAENYFTNSFMNLCNKIMLQEFPNNQVNLYGVSSIFTQDELNAFQQSLHTNLQNSSFNIMFYPNKRSILASIITDIFDNYISKIKSLFNKEEFQFCISHYGTPSLHINEFNILQKRDKQKSKFGLYLIMYAIIYGIYYEDSLPPDKLAQKSIKFALRMIRRYKDELGIAQ